VGEWVGGCNPRGFKVDRNQLDRASWVPCVYALGGVGVAPWRVMDRKLPGPDPHYLQASHARNKQ
jgi:hypothetical protein